MMSRADDDVARLQLAVGCLENEAPFSIATTQPPHLHLRAIGWIEARGIALDVGDDRVAAHEAAGRVAVVGESRQLAVAVRRDQAEGIPAPAPGVADMAAIEHHVLAIDPFQVPADRQPGLAAADDDGV